MSAAARQQAAAAPGGAGSAPVPLTVGAGVPGRVLERCAARPRAVVLRVKRLGIWEETTGEELVARVLRLSSALSALGAGAGGGAGWRVALLADGSPATIALDLAAQHAGATSVWCYPTRGVAELGELLERCDPALVVCADEEQLAKLHGAGWPRGAVRVVVEDVRRLPRPVRAAVLDMAELELLGDAPGSSCPAGPPAAACAIAWSAGTSGPARPVALTHEAQVAAMSALSQAVGLGPRDRVLACVPLAQPTARTLAYAALANGAVLHFPESPETIPENLVEVVPTVLFGPPRLADLLRREDAVRAGRSSRPKRALHRAGVSSLISVAERRERGDTGALDGLRRALAMLVVGLPLKKRLGLAGARCLLVGGAAVSPETVRFFAALGVGLRPCYGLAETCGVAALGAAGAPFGPLELLPGHEARLVGEAMLELRGPSVVPPAGAGEWLATGDVASLELASAAGRGPAQRLRLLGRSSETLPLAGGGTLPLASIVAVLGRSPSVDLVAPLALEGEPGAVAVLVQPDREVLADWARRRGLHQVTYAALVAEPEVRALITAELAQAAASLPSGLQLVRSELLPRPLDEEESELTPLRQVRLDVVRARFGHLVGLEGGAAPATVG